MSSTFIGYERSHALVIGINEYLHETPLQYARNDAIAVAEFLETKLGFDNVVRLIDQDATTERIRGAFLKFARSGTNENDRILFYYAGHGCTHSSKYGDVGYLVPHNGNGDSLESLLRWDHLTQDADLINAKHILFVMDACYGGLAINRSSLSGSSRFLKDMLSRRSWQVITSGKADEPVSDGGGPRPKHSIFTGHFLDAIEGKAAIDNIVTANSVMAHVYKHVGLDSKSKQTPHFGYLKGDGDFIFNSTTEISKELKGDDRKEVSKFISFPKTDQIFVATEQVSDNSRITTLIHNPDRIIELRGEVVQATRDCIADLDHAFFPLDTAWSVDELEKRLGKYNATMEKILSIQMILGFWAKAEHLEIASIPIKRIVQGIDVRAGVSAWLDLRWYPAILLIYACGMGGIYSRNYSPLYSLLTADSQASGSRQRESSILSVTLFEMRNNKSIFNTLPNHLRQYAPISEYLYKYLQPISDDLLFIGQDYESVFDQLELLISLQYEYQKCHGMWLGRFAWKHSQALMGLGRSPLEALDAVVKESGTKWDPLQAGFFGGSLLEFKKTMASYRSKIDELGWH